MSFENAMKSLNLEELDYDIDTVKKTYDLNQLANLKQEIELKLSYMFDRLKNELHADMNTKLVTEDGFPRNDINVVQIRLVRVRIIRLRNDLKTVIGLLQSKISKRFKQVNAGVPVTDLKKSNFDTLIAFATVKEVASSGPADKAGLQVDDRILRFGTIDVTNHQHLNNLAPVVRENIGKTVEIVVQRRDARSILKLSPSNNWNGRGLLGCRLVEIK